MRYAKNTNVSVGKSKSEIEDTLRGYGATEFMSYENETRIRIAFRMHGRNVMFELPKPDKDDPQFHKTETGRKRDSGVALAAWDQAVRQTWRVLLLAVKGKLELISSGLLKFEDEFMAYTLLPDGKTVSQHILPRIDETYSCNKMVALLPAPREGK